MSTQQIRNRFAQPFCCIAVLLCLFSCSEKLAPENLPPIQNETLDLKALFEKRGYNESLKEDLNDSLEILWNPSWTTVFKKFKDDSIQYAYVPLTPELRNSKTKSIVKNVNFLGFTKYILVKISSSHHFYLAKYSAENGMDLPENLDNFTGSVVIHNLDDQKNSFYQYLNGELVKNSKAQTNLRTTDDCVKIVECSWGNWDCGGVNITSTTGEYSCNYPSWTPCFGGTWEVTYSTTTEVCTPSDPIDPITPINIPTTTYEAISQNFKVNAPSQNLTDIINYLKCFHRPPVINGQELKDITISIKIDQPLANSNVPVTASSIPVGHAYLEIRQSQGSRSPSIVRSIGFWPGSSIVTPVNPSVTGVFNDDSQFSGSLDVEATFSISYDEFITVRNYITSYTNQNYDLMNRNCANFCSDVLSQIGINIPNSWQNTFWYSGSNSGSPNPNNVYGPSVGAYGQVLKSFSHPKLISKTLSNVAARRNNVNCN